MLDIVAAVTLGAALTCFAGTRFHRELSFRARLRFIKFFAICAGGNFVLVVDAVGSHNTVASIVTLFSAVSLVYSGCRLARAAKTVE